MRSGKAKDMITRIRYCIVVSEDECDRYYYYHSFRDSKSGMNINFILLVGDDWLWQFNLRRSLTSGWVAFCLRPGRTP